MLEYKDNLSANTYKYNFRSLHIMQTSFVYVFEVIQDESRYSKGVSLGRKGKYTPRDTGAPNTPENPYWIIES